MKAYCFHCCKPLGQLSFEFFHNVFKGELVGGGRKTFCNEECYSKYLQKYFVEEYNGNKIYWLLKGRQKYYIPYAGCYYGFETIEGCRERVNTSNIGIMY